MNGIGGNTITKAKENLSLDEFRCWQEYIRKRGSINNARRLDLAVSKIEFILLKVNGDKETKYTDLLQYEDKIEDNDSKKKEKIATTDDVINLFKSIS